MESRFYLVKIAYNKVAQAEDRTIGGYNSEDEAIKAFHSYMYQNILGPTIGWCYACVMTDNGVKIMEERWQVPELLIKTESDVVSVISQYVADHNADVNLYSITQYLEQNLFNIVTPPEGE